MGLISCFIVTIFLLFSSSSQAEEPFSFQKRIRQVSRTNQALAVVYRELAKKSSSTESFKLTKFDLKIVDDNTSILSVNIIHQILLRSNTIQTLREYTIIQSKSGLPKVQKVDSLSNIKLNYHKTLSNSEPKNRAKSLVYYWTSLMDQKSSPINKYLDLVSEKSLQIQIANYTIQNKNELSAFLQKRGSQILQSSHIIDNLSVLIINKNTYKILFEYDVRAEDINGTSIISRIKQEWILIDGNGEFPKIQSIKRQYLLPKIKTGTRVRC